jgi:23S rRNA (cytidine1920-2'-O)/16S rRNA (cytidine1409-2'-O)-methyltransferase
MRLDQLLTQKNLVESREKAKAAIMAGLVYVDGQKVTKPGTNVSEDAQVEVKGPAVPYVSRGGLKLEKALEVFNIDPTGLVAVDVGASTGGFTDCLLQRGAVRVYAIDVGYGQLDWKLRQDPRVIVMERTNIRYVDPDRFPEKADLAVIDVSFISLTKIFGVVLSLLKDTGEVVALIKPQFEAGREHVGKKGVVRDSAVHVEVLGRLSRELQAEGAGLVGLSFSPITGPEGNIEYLSHFKKACPPQGWEKQCLDVVEQAWQAHKQP